jgi:outer membrane biogenesis lipoprotein LolB
MRTHILAGLMALILTACASNHRSVASVQKTENDIRAQESGVDAGMADRDFASANR